MIKLENILLPDDKFILAVSGGVDSMVLLDIARRRKGGEGYIVAYFDHGIRDKLETDRDRAVIKKFCERYHIEYLFGEHEEETPLVSESDARDARYKFFFNLMDDKSISYLVLAHHKDDLIETAIINILRGSGFRGLASMGESEWIKRPMLSVYKDEIIEYAAESGVEWHEDITNESEDFLRNYIRINIVPKIKESDMLTGFEEYIFSIQKMMEEFDELISEVVDSVVDKIEARNWRIDRYQFIMLDHKIACEVIRELYRDNRFGVPERRLIDKTVVFCKTARNKARLDVSKNVALEISDNKVLCILKNE